VSIFASATLVRADSSARRTERFRRLIPPLPVAGLHRPGGDELQNIAMLSFFYLEQYEPVLPDQHWLDRLNMRSIIFTYIY